MNTTELQLIKNEGQLYPKIKDILNVFQLYSESGDILSKLSEILKSSLLLIDYNGRIKALKLFGPCSYHCRLQQEDISMQLLLLNANSEIENNCPFTDNDCIDQDLNNIKVLPFWKNGYIMGHLIILSSTHESPLHFNVLTEMVNIFFSSLLAQEKDLEAEYNKQKLKLALNSLTHLQKRIILNIFKQIDKKEHSIVIKIKKVAEEFNVAPSVVNRGLKKLQSAGVIQQWQLSPKGTFISITNNYLVENLDILIDF